MEEFYWAFTHMEQDPKLSDVLITSERVTGRCAQGTKRALRKDENERGLRNAARSVERLPGWTDVVSRLSRVI